MSKVEQGIFTQGTCEYCGQTRTVDTCETQEEADALAAVSCHCEDGQELAKDEEAADKREEALADAESTIDEYFSNGEISEEVRDLILSAAALVYDAELPQVILTLRRGANGINAVLSRTDKGKFTVKRKDNGSKEKVIGE